MKDHELVFILNASDGDKFHQIGLCTCGVPLEAWSEVSRAGARRGVQKHFLSHLKKVTVE